MDLEQLLDDILDERISILDLNTEQREAVTGHLRETFTDMLDGDEAEIGQTLLGLLDLIEEVNLTDAVWEDDIQASIKRGNTYFVMEKSVLQ